MLALRGQSQVGNMLHLIVGPETELFGDIHGAAVLDITALLSDMDGNEQVFLTMTRCRSEQITAHNMQTTGMKFTNSFNAGEPELAGQPNIPPVQAPVPDAVRDAVRDSAKNQRVTGVCTYCNQSQPLLRVPGFSICQVCAQIELGRAGLKPNDTESQLNDTSAPDSP